MVKNRFDVAAFQQVLDSTRRARGLAWVDVARATGVSPAMLTRLKHGTSPSAHGLAALSSWAGVHPANFLVGPAGQATEAARRPDGSEPIAVALLALNGDPQLSFASRAVLTTVMLTTYQQLAAMTARETVPA